MTIIIDFVKRERNKGTFQNVPNGKVETHTLYLPPAMDDNFHGRVSIYFQVNCKVTSLIF